MQNISPYLFEVIIEELSTCIYPHFQKGKIEKKKRYHFGIMINYDFRQWVNISLSMNIKYPEQSEEEKNDSNQ